MLIEMFVKVIVGHTESTNWWIDIIISDEASNFTYTLTIDTPYSYSLEVWRRAVSGKECPNTPISLDNGHYQLSTWSEEGGLGSSVMLVKTELLSTKLSEAIDEAVRMDLKFVD